MSKRRTEGKRKRGDGGCAFAQRSCTARERERENSVFVYRNKQAGAKTRWVRYIAVNY